MLVSENWYVDVGRTWNILELHVGLWAGCSNNDLESRQKLLGREGCE